MVVDPTRTARNLKGVHDRMREACARVGRPPDSVKLVAVSKTVGMDEVRILASLGVRDFGENRVHELVRKATGLAELGLEWHMIGHLQRNKVKDLLGHSRIVHSLESEALADVLSRRSADLDLQIDVLIEVNVAGEASKYGIRPEDAPALAAKVASLSALNLRGLMTMAPIVDDPERVRPLFARLRELAATLAPGLPPDAMRDLSMGMTQDFEVAIEEGATLIRVGSAIFA